MLWRHKPEWITVTEAQTELTVMFQPSSSETYSRERELLVCLFTLMSRICSLSLGSGYRNIDLLHGENVAYWDLIGLKTKREEWLQVVHLWLSWLAHGIQKGGVVFFQEVLPWIGDVDNKGELAHNKHRSLFSNPSVQLLFWFSNVYFCSDTSEYK